MVSVWRWLLANRKYFIIFLTPILLLPLPLVVPTKEASCGYVIVLMALFWCTEALPLAVTALFPVVLFPMMGIMNSTAACSQYLKDTNMLFIGGLLVAISVEKWNLHKRIALRVLLLVGVKPALLLLGFMVVTAFLSMWISNTATTAMMIPIAQAVLQQLYTSEEKLEDCPSDNVNQDENQMNGVTKLGLKDNAPEEFKALDKQPNGNINQTFEMYEKQPIDSDLIKQGKPSVTAVAIDLEDEKSKQEGQDRRKQKHMKLCKGMSLCVCYSASIGGIATLTGTTPNLVMKGQMDELFPGNNNVINFASWFGFAFPTMILLLLLAWIWLQLMFLGTKFKKNFGCGGKPEQKEKEKRAYRVISEEHKKLGSMTFAEICVLVLFTLLVLLWFSREPGFMPGWATISFNKGGKEYVTDATVAVFISLTMFFFPSELPSCKAQDPEQPGKRIKIYVPPPLLDWKTVNEKMPWNIVILLGGGFALAKGSEDSGLSTWLGDKLTPLQSIPPAAIALVLCLLVATFTECTSNVATTTLFLPILASMAKAIELNPLYIMLPCTLSASLAFMLPVATPPNAIAFAYGQLRVVDMAKAGFLLNILGVLVITLSINSWGYYMFNLDTFPTWANSTIKP
ncbi:PREDICTED: solute carrier family 13 member 2 isoform X1 [Nanorana parkeri]|uniref:solute carrier family 13 member 2 isoform X1 n=1 Tax=Nanorana parkeri TaxID=125878 RepID=UPI000854F97A|nr:PREDICTED: solute carrier family 13 member 2 isoform X1 [Nanorana parkeri]